MNMLGFDHQNIPTKGYISVQKEEEKDEQTKCLTLTSVGYG